MQNIQNRREFLSKSAKTLVLLGIAMQGGLAFATESKNTKSKMPELK